MERFLARSSRRQRRYSDIRYLQGLKPWIDCGHFVGAKAPPSCALPQPAPERNEKGYWSLQGLSTEPIEDPPPFGVEYPSAGAQCRVVYGATATFPLPWSKTPLRIAFRCGSGRRSIAYRNAVRGM